jgi:hypothetical protein
MYEKSGEICGPERCGICREFVFPTDAIMVLLDHDPGDLGNGPNPSIYPDLVHRSCAQSKGLQEMSDEELNRWYAENDAVNDCSSAYSEVRDMDENDYSHEVFGYALN